MRKRNKSIISIALAFIMAITQLNTVPIRAEDHVTSLNSANSKYGNAQAGWDWEGKTGVRITIATNGGGTVKTKDFFAKGVDVDAWVSGSGKNNTKLDYLKNEYTANIVEADPDRDKKYDYDILPNLPRTVSGSTSMTDAKVLFDFFSKETTQKSIFDLMGTPEEHDGIDKIYDLLAAEDPVACETYYMIIEPLAIANVTMDGDTKSVVMSAGDAIAWNSTTISSSAPNGIMAKNAPSIINNLQLGLQLSEGDVRLDLDKDTYKSGECDESNLNEALKGGWGVAIIRWSTDIYSSITCYVDENRNGKWDAGEEIMKKPLGKLMVDLLNLGGESPYHDASTLWRSIKTFPEGLEQEYYDDGDRVCWFSKIYATRDKDGMTNRLLTVEAPEKADSSNMKQYMSNVYTDADADARAVCTVSASHGGVHYFVEYRPPITATIEQVIITADGTEVPVKDSKQTSPVEIQEGKPYTCAGAKTDNPFQGVLFPALKVKEWETCTYNGVEYKFDKAGYQFKGSAEIFSNVKSMTNFANGSVFTMNEKRVIYKIKNS